MWDWIKEGTSQALAEEEFSIEHFWEDEIEATRSTTSLFSAPSSAPTTPCSSTPASREQGGAIPLPRVSPNLGNAKISPAAPALFLSPPVEHATPLEGDDNRLDTYYDDEPPAIAW